MQGPPDAQPEFEEFDAYTSPSDGRLVPFTNVYACNWLQVSENLIDHYHAATLHNNMTVASVDSEVAEGVSLGQCFRTMPVIQWEKTRDGNSMMFSAGRRIADDKVWIRITEMTFPNFVQTASVVPTAAELRHTTVGLTRWHVPVDDHNMIIFGWRHFNDEIDPKHTGDENECGIDKVDFLIGQTSHRTYLEGQLAPGDYEAITSIGKIAPHALEHPGRSDIGVYMCRNLLRAAIRGETPPDSTRVKARAAGDTLPMYSADSVLNIPRATDRDDDDLLRDLSNEVVAIMKECDSVASADRKQYASRRLDDLDGGMVG
ncbi:MAG: hypothetical protein O3C28_07455 [Proteobacteria bacterium]|nr:hypothetical protein [Pseudomonadota bacterium]